MLEQDFEAEKKIINLDAEPQLQRSLTKQPKGFDNELDTKLGSGIRDTDFQLMAALSFHLSALQLLWAPEFVSLRERGL